MASMFRLGSFVRRGQIRNRDVEGNRVLSESFTRTKTKSAGFEVECVGQRLGIQGAQSGHVSARERVSGAIGHGEIPAASLDAQIRLGEFDFYLPEMPVFAV